MIWGDWQRFGACAVAGLCAAATLTASAAPAPQRPWGGGAEATEVMVAFRETAPPQARVQTVQRLGLEVSRSGRRLARLRLGAGARQRRETLRSVVRRLRQDPHVRVAEPDFRVRATFTPNDPGFPNLWGLHNTGQTGGTPDADIDAPEAWEQTTGSPEVVVAVIDTGVDLSHPDLAENILRNAQGKVVGYDFANNDANPTDDDGHGSHVAGTIGARGNNLQGVVGVSPLVRIMPVKFLDASGNGNVSDAIEAIDFAIQNGAHIMSNSWGGGGYSQLLAEAVGRARNAGILFVAAAGNDSTNNDSRPTYPANFNRVYDNVISVAASTEADLLPAFSNYGAQTVDIAAPGERVYSTYKGGTYATLDGTSMATPHVAGAAALIKAKFPSLNYLQIRTRLLTNVDTPQGLAGRVRTGRLNVNSALNADGTPPGAPSGLTATLRASDALMLTWTASGDDGAAGQAQQYELRYNTAPITEANFHLAALAEGLPSPAPSGEAQSFLLSGLTSNTQYYMALRAMDNVGNYSALAVSAPFTTSPSGQAVVPVFDNAEGALLFTGQGSWATTTEAFFSPNRSYADSPGASYAPNTDASLTLASSVLLSGFSPRLEYRIRHDLEDGYDFLLVEISPDGQNWTSLPATYSGNNGSWQPASISLAPYYGLSVQVRFRLVSDSIVHQNGAWLDDLRITGAALQAVNGPPVPAAPSGFAGSASSQTSVLLTWVDNSSDETGFRVDRRVGASGAWSTLNSVATNSTQLADNTVQANTQYTYRLVAFNGAGDSPASVAAVTTPPIAPTAPTNLQATGGAGKVTLLWNGSAGATSYTVRRGTTAGGPHEVYKTGVTVPTLVDSSVTTGIQYFYTVSAVNAGGESPQSAEASAVPQGIPPSAPTNIRARRKTARKSQVTWTQSTSAGVVKNRVYRSDSPSGPWSLLAEINATRSYTDTTLVRNTPYYYTVTAVTGEGLESPRSSAAFVKKR